MVKLRLVVFTAVMYKYTNTRKKVLVEFTENLPCSNGERSELLGQPAKKNVLPVVVGARNGTDVFSNYRTHVICERSDPGLNSATNSVTNNRIISVSFELLQS